MAFAAAIPALAGLGGSIFGGISGKKAAKEQRKMMQDYLNRLQPVIDASIKGQQEALGLGKSVAGQTMPYLKQGGAELGNLMEFWRPLVSGDRTAIDQFLAPERRAINQGYQSVVESLGRFAPRGGGRVSSLAKADIGRQGQISDLVFGARKQAAQQQQQLAQLLSNLGLGGVSAGMSAVGGVGGGSQNLFGLVQSLMGQSNAVSANAQAGLSGIGEQLGTFLSKIFRPGTGGRGTTPPPYNPDMPGE